MAGMTINDEGLLKINIIVCILIQPILTPQWVIGSFIVLGIVFIPIGIVVLAASRGVSNII